jgi:glucose-1-phosphate cytidylyltransferase
MRCAVLSGARWFKLSGGGCASVKTVILAGGLGTRLAEETVIKPKPMVEIGGRPILNHIMRWYAHFGYREFVVALGYKGEVIKQYFLNYFALNNDLTVSLRDGRTTFHNRHDDDWVVHLIDTGQQTMTGGRLSRLRHLLTDETFLLTYGDGLADVNIDDLVAFHRKHGKVATVTAVHPPSRFGGLLLEGSRVAQFAEKLPLAEDRINGGFFVLQRDVLGLIEDDQTIWERKPLESLAAAGELMAYRHDGFWQPMDNIREKQVLEDLWQSGKAPWCVER